MIEPDIHSVCKLCQGAVYVRQCRHSRAWRMAQFGDAEHVCHRGIEIGFLADEKIGDYAEPEDGQNETPKRGRCAYERPPRLPRPCCGDRFMCAHLVMPVTGGQCGACEQWEPQGT